MVEPISAAFLLNAPGARTGGGDADEDADEDTLAPRPLTTMGATFGDEDADEDAIGATTIAPSPLTRVAAESGRRRGDGGDGGDDDDECVFDDDDDVDDRGVEDAVAATATVFFDFER